jgi:CubicO group peptidase (beta-lactamase class C family)
VALRGFRKFVGWSISSLALAASVLMIALWANPPELIRVAAGYAAKIVCSNVFLAGRDPLEVLATDVQAPGHPLLKLMRVDVDREQGLVRAGLLGIIGRGLAVARPNVGCAVVPGGGRDGTRSERGRSTVRGEGPHVSGENGAIPALQRIIEDDALAGRGMRAIVVVQDGRVVAERYAGGFGATMPQLGWSMTKSVTAGLIGILIKDGRLTLDQSAGLGTDDARSRITIADLMSMSSGLKFNEAYGAVSDITRMLYLQSDMAAFAGAKPLEHPVGRVWSYSSGSAVILSRIFQDAAGPDAVRFLQSRLFDPLGMKSAVMEADQKGTLVGSSYMYATPRDWARYGQLLVQDGVWEGREILPPGYVAMMGSPAAASGGEYGRGMVWRWVTHSTTPGENPDTAFGIPPDAFWMAGHDGQYVAVIPSRRLVVVRMGLTPEREHYRPEPLVRYLLEAGGGRSSRL